MCLSTPSLSHAPFTLLLQGHAISYDFPPSMAEYAMRLSHTAKGGHPGRCTTFVNDSAEIDQVKALAEVFTHSGNEVPRWLEAIYLYTDPAAAALPELG